MKSKGKSLPAAPQKHCIRKESDDENISPFTRTFTKQHVNKK